LTCLAFFHPPFSLSFSHPPPPLSYSSTLLNALYVFFLVATYGALLLFIGRPLLTRYMDRAARAESETLQSSLLALTFMAIFLSAFFTVRENGKKGKVNGRVSATIALLLMPRLPFGSWFFPLSLLFRTWPACTPSLAPFSSDWLSRSRIPLPFALPRRLRTLHR
jgi:hypothetical protein